MDIFIIGIIAMLLVMFDNEVQNDKKSLTRYEHRSRIGKKRGLK